MWRTSSKRRTRTSVAAGARNVALIASRLSSYDNFGYALRMKVEIIKMGNHSISILNDERKIRFPIFN